MVNIFIYIASTVEFINIQLLNISIYFIHVFFKLKMFLPKKIRVFYIDKCFHVEQQYYGSIKEVDLQR